MLFRSKIPPAQRTAVVPENPTRAAVRFPVELPAALHVGEEVLQATTVDVSSTGVLFTLERTLVAGTELSWEMCLPSETMGTEHDIDVTCEGRVVWVREVNPVRMAVMIDRYQIKEHAE